MQRFFKTLVFRSQPLRVQLPQAANPFSFQEEKEENLSQAWIAFLLLSTSLERNQKSLRQLIRQSADAYYQDLKMDGLLSKYHGDLPTFILSLLESWGWKIDYDKESGVFIANGNKETYVCPIIRHREDMNSSIICYRSEGFAEIMFSSVVGNPVRAEVLSSVRRGEATCRHKNIFALDFKTCCNG